MNMGIMARTIVHRHGHANRHSCATHRRYSTACPSESIHSPRRMSQQSAAVGRAVPARSEVATQLGGTPGRRARGCGAAPCLTTDGRCTSRMAISCRCAPRHAWPWSSRACALSGGSTQTLDTTGPRSKRSGGARRRARGVVGAPARGCTLRSSARQHRWSSTSSGTRRRWPTSATWPSRWWATSS